MNDRTSNRSSGLFGAASLLVIFAVLCLSMLALITLQRVRTGSDASVRAAEQTAALYEAECMAHEILADLRAGKQPENVVRDGDFYTYICPISGTTALEVTAELTENGTFIIHAWHRISLIRWQTDEMTGVWDGTIPNGEES